MKADSAKKAREKESCLLDGWLSITTLRKVKPEKNTEAKNRVVFPRKKR